MNRRKSSIMLVLLLLIGLFIAGMWLMSSLNLNFAQRAMSEQRQQQIADTFHSNLDRINAHHFLMEQNTGALARMGELFARQKQISGRDNLAELERSVGTTLRSLHDLYGGGILFHPGAYRLSDVGIYGHRNSTATHITYRETGFENKDWYRRLQPSSLPGKPNELYHWTAAYYRPQFDTVVISVSTPLHDSTGQVIGLAATDWQADEVIRLVSRVRITPGTFSFLLDRENRNLSSLAEAADVQQAQQLMEAITALQLPRQSPAQQVPASLGSRYPASPMQSHRLFVGEAEYALFHAPTEAGMIFGIGIPQAEIDAVLAPMRASNFRIVAIIVSILLLLSGLILYLVATTLKQLNSLYTDALTGLPNRERLLLDLQKGRPLTLVLLNIDSFKEINDFYGSQCGDHVIRELADGLRRHVHDTPAWKAVRVYRMPGDEMALLFPDSPGQEVLEQRLENLRTFIKGLTIRWQEEQVPLQATLGLAASVQPDGSPLASEQLLPSANIALKLARLSKLNYLVHDPAHRMRETYEQNLVWANRLRTALEQNRIVPWFQPIMNLHTGRIDKFECLVRMLDGDDTPISPAHFLPVARKIRLYRQITRRMVDQCLARFAETDLQFSLNLSCDDLLDSELSEHLLQRLQNPALARRLIFEILESEGIENYQAVRQFIDKAKALGCRIAIDDFGTGYSNFEHLLRLDVDLIKIDGSLIRQLDSDADARAVTQGIVRFAQELGMQTVAEFVHNEAILQQVRALGIDFAQGARIGMPAPELPAGLCLDDIQG
ncbi:EAL domain-containing protein [Halopseudomonas bauzanensis]|uniref:Diguanylate cyclase (GGDEF) domain-containing protein n=1 Tax=Halopseudomonas bauzanensis TaxID=653930 RepID=A0A1I4JEF4_9GAMM|nr:EAL domain-containing protein [Halopseudomonas bauzanensis]SER60986.1 diguanylate cyclase (GGDEF) domain-containing protein [Halopseudomonas bauzanensis]SFL64952.1 diguanylate cyclase (GGDEF) domain-containing protein [Halopseudomonas bauzanensis]